MSRSVPIAISSVSRPRRVDGKKGGGTTSSY